MAHGVPRHLGFKARLESWSTRIHRPRPRDLKTVSKASWSRSVVQPRPKEYKYQKLPSRSNNKRIRNVIVRAAGLFCCSKTVTEWLAALDSERKRNPMKERQGRKTKHAMSSSCGILLCLQDLSDATKKKPAGSTPAPVAGKVLVIFHTRNLSSKKTTV